MDIFNLLKEMSKYCGIAGNEQDIAEFAENCLKQFCQKTWQDKIGNVFGFIQSKLDNAKKLMIEAHLDCVGLMVKEIDENGFLKFEKVGPVDERVLPASEVIVLGKENLFGVIGAKPAHIAGSDKTRPHSDEMLIDIGLKKDAAEKLVKPGDFICLKSTVVQHLNNRVSGVGLAGHSGIAAVLEFLDKTKSTDLPYDVYITFSVGRNMGSVGAYSAAYAVRPDMAVVVDSIPARYNSNYTTGGSVSLGSGGVISRTPDVCYEGALKLIEEAKKQNISFSLNASGQVTMTDATAIQNVAGAVHTFLLSVPIRYMHQTVEMVYLDDISACSDLIYLISSGGVEFA